MSGGASDNYAKWNFKVRISAMFRFDYVNDLWISGRDIVRKSPFRNYLLPYSLLTSKVNLGLEWEQSQSQNKCSSYSHCHKDPVDVMIDGDAWHLKISDRSLK